MCGGGENRGGCRCWLGCGLWWGGGGKGGWLGGGGGRRRGIWGLLLRGRVLGLMMKAWVWRRKERVWVQSRKGWVLLWMKAVEDLACAWGASCGYP